MTNPIICGFCGHTTKALDSKFCINCGTSFPKVTNGNNSSDEVLTSILNRLNRLNESQQLVKPKQKEEPEKLDKASNNRLHEEYHNLLAVKFDNKIFSYSITCSFCGKQIPTNVNNREVIKDE